MDVFPRARSSHLIVRELGHETLVYDTKSHQATCLSALAREVWSLCDGERCVEEIADACESELIDAEIVCLTLRKLSKANLLETPFQQTQEDTTRRSVVGQLAGTMSLAMAVTMISVPAASQGASCLPRFSACTVDEDCCSNDCRITGWFNYCR